MDTDYSNREIDRLFGEIKEQLDRIEHQTTRTNGRVNKLENWRSVLIGGWTIVTLIVLPLLSYMYFYQNKVLADKIEDINLQTEESNL